MAFVDDQIRQGIRRAKWGNWLSHIVVTRKCNLACGYCNEYDKTSRPVPTETLRRSIAHLKSLGTFTLGFTGGEPLLHPDIIDLLSYARDIGIARRSMITNGFLLTQKIVEGLNEAGLRDMQISIDGIHANAVTEKVLDNLHKRLAILKQHANFRVTIGVVIGSTNMDEAEQLVDYSLTEGFEVNLNILHDEHGQLKLDTKTLAAYADLVKRIHGMDYDLSGDYRWRLVNGDDADFRCRGGSRYLYVDEFQRVSYCSQTRMEDPTKDLFAYTWQDMKKAFLADKDCNQECTVGCVRRVSRLDSWRPTETKVRGLPRSLLSEIVIQARKLR